MRDDRKRTKCQLKAIRTVKEFNDLIDGLLLKDEEKEIVKDVFIKGLSHQQIAMKYCISVSKSHKVVQKALDKALR